MKFTKEFRLLAMLAIELSCLTGSSQTAITDNLVGYWRFDETSGSTALDSSGAGREGTLIHFPSDGTQWVPGQIAGALDFRGIDFADYVTVADFTRPTTTMTLSVWVWADTFPRWATIAANFSGVYGPFYFGMHASDPLLSVYLTEQPSGGSINVPNGYDLDLLSPRAWHHVGFVADGRRVRIWRDGDFVASFLYNGTIMNPPPVPQLEIGGSTSFGPNQGYWDGKLDDLGLWTRALSGTEMRAIYEAGLNGLPLTVVPEPSCPVLLTAGLLLILCTRVPSNHAAKSNEASTRKGWLETPTPRKCTVPNEHEPYGNRRAR
jgi:hypothetical protein